MHLLSWAIVLGGWLANVRAPRLTPGMLHGAISAFVIGILLTGIASSSALDKTLNHMKIGIKGVVALAVVLLLITASRRVTDAAELTATAPETEGATAVAVAPAPSALESKLVRAAGLLVIVNVALAVLWR